MSCVEQAIELLRRREAVGTERYGPPLTAGDKRRLGEEADEEMADWLIYWMGYRAQHERAIQSLLDTIERQAGVIATLHERIGALEGK